MMEPVLKVVDLGVDYRARKGNLPALRKINLSVYAGQIVGLVGESGCGKSTLASAVMQLLPQNGRISAGEILFKGRDLIKLNSEERQKVRGKEISMIFQDPMTSFNPVFTIGQQMVDSILSHQQGKGYMGRQVACKSAIEMLDKVGIPDPEERIKDYPHQFSGGMRQRIMIATALQSNPALLIADEPTSALDVTLQAQIIALIRSLRDENQTGIIYITHDLGVVAQLCDYVIVLYAGGIVESGEVYNIFKNPLHPYTRALLRSHPSRHAQVYRLTTIRGRVPSLKNLPAGCKFADRCDFAREICFKQEAEEYRVEGQHVFCHLYPEHGNDLTLESASGETSEHRESIITSSETSEKENVLCVAQVETHFYDSVSLLGRILGKKAGVVKAVDKIDLEVKHGEILAIVGESGCGKTTLGRTILRLVELHDGAIYIGNQNMTSLTQKQIRPMRARMQMIFQDPFSSLSPRKTVSQLLLEPFKIHRVAVDKSRKVDELLEMVGLSAEQADKYPHQLSGGQARRVGIARALALQPDLLIADEPTAGLDVSVAAEVLNLLKDLREQLGLTYIIITHNLDIIGFIANRVAVMYLGKIIEVGETRKLLANPGHPYTQALMSAVALPDPELRDHKTRIILEGEIPSPRHLPTGCAFHPRCRYRQDICMKKTPSLRKIAENEGLHYLSCHFPVDA